ncbi:hypothetical protein F2Q68_00008810 [Brassica cretica]|uniref:Uncharacterized protein n=1 Tax=Brassica cretica TaxID=69181 RepID=A0A8S9KND0_BRACR|nr:hypothetical protein F2Q68_00008810 [Brassica cretica]
MGAEKKWLFTLFSVAFLSVFLLLLYSFSAFTSNPFPSPIRHGPHYPPSFAYYITGGRGDGDRIFRLLLAVYHPRNRYLLHLGAEATDAERVALLSDLKSVPAVSAFGNVDVLGKVHRLSENGFSNSWHTPTSYSRINQITHRHEQSFQVERVRTPKQVPKILNSYVTF